MKTDDKKQKNAETVYGAICRLLDEKDVEYEKEPENLVLHFSMQSEDLPVEIQVKVDAGRELVRIHSPLPFAFGESTRLEGAIATCQLNFLLADGSFDYDFRSGRALFRLTTSFAESLLSDELFTYLFACAVYIVDKYNDKLFLLNKGALSIEDFIREITQD